ncbi:MAG: UDP-3-O-(3-hydroxymyristoyl)glucosamine N-acyltransferase [Thiohalocapsa sp.]
MFLDLTGLATRLDIPIPSEAYATNVRFDGVNTLEQAAATDICFAEQTEHAERVSSSAAGAVLVPEEFPAVSGPLLIRVLDPRGSFFAIAACFLPAAEAAGVHASAQVDPSARLGEGVSIGACAVVAANASIGDGCVIGAGVWIGATVTLGANCVIEANVMLHPGSSLGERCVIHSGAVIGGDGFGFQWDGQRHRKVPQLGKVVVEDDVDIGCNSCIDRATLGETRIRRGVRIDNLVQIGHNTDIGEHVILVSQSGVAGSSTVGKGAMIAGQVAVSDHIKVGAGARIAGQSGVTKDVPAGAAVFGTPARPMKDTLRELAALSQLPDTLKEVRRQRRELADLEKRLRELSGQASSGSVN